MKNNFFQYSKDKQEVSSRILELEKAYIGFYSIGLYPLSLAYNSAMHSTFPRLLLSPRPGRELFGAINKKTLSSMDPDHINRISSMAINKSDIQSKDSYNSLADLFLRCDLVVLTSNSKHIESDLNEAIALRKSLKRVIL